MERGGTVLLDRYRLERRLGSGGMAEVYRATDLATDGAVAVKLLHHHLAEDPAFVDRFVREARSVASLDHPNVVRVIDSGAVEGRPFLVLELVDGESLDKLVKREGALPIGRAVSIAADLLAGLEHAHARGLIHRDVKPHNVLIGPDGRAKLADFGIARSLASQTMTLDGSVFGSAGYVAPERLSGQPASAASDLYGVGVLLHELLTGRLPFVGDIASIAHQHVHAVPRPPSRLRPEVPAWLDEIVLRALAKTPIARFPSARAMRAALVEGARTRPKPISIVVNVHETPPPVLTDGVIRTPGPARPVIPPPNGRAPAVAAPVDRDILASLIRQPLLLVAALAIGIVGLLAVLAGGGPTEAGSSGAPPTIVAGASAERSTPTGAGASDVAAAPSPTRRRPTATPSDPTATAPEPTVTEPAASATEPEPTATPEPPSPTPAPPTEEEIAIWADNVRVPLAWGYAFVEEHGRLPRDIPELEAWLDANGLR